MHLVTLSHHKAFSRSPGGMRTLIWGRVLCSTCSTGLGSPHSSWTLVDRTSSYLTSSFSSLKKIFYLFIFRERRREGKREGEKHWCMRETSIGCPLLTPNWGSGLQPRHVPWQGIEPATFQLAGWCSISWAIPARASYLSSYLFVTVLGT